MTNRKYYSNIVFSTSPLTGFYRFENLFQIFPLPNEGRLRYKHETHFPIVIEYWVNESEKKEVKHPMFEGAEDIVSIMTLKSNWLQLLTRLLSAFTNHRFFIYDPEPAWYFPGKTEEYEATQSSWGIKHYSFDGMDEKLRIKEFTKVDLKPVPMVKHAAYFQNPNIDDSTIEITISKHTDLLFKAFQMLTSEERKFFDAAITLICNGQDLKYKMRSISYISFISSIETMASLQFKEKQNEIELQCNSCKLIKSSPFTCPECGNPIWGISQQFKKYLSFYTTTDPKINSILNRIYGIRSKIVHSGQLLLGDAFIDWDKHDQENSELETLLTLMQYSKLSICNWLLYNARNKVAIKRGLPIMGP